MSREDKLIEALNKMIEACEPISYFQFNTILREKEKGLLLKIEEADNKIGLYSDDKTSTIAIIATITDILIDKRLGVILDDSESKIIKGFTYYVEE